MRILHTADWHLGKTIAFTGFDLAPVHEAVLERIVAIAERESVDMIIIAGDLFDSANPPARAERLLINALKRLAEGGGGRPVIVVAGNHDSPERLGALNPFSMESLIFIGGFVKDEFGSVRMDKGRWKVRGSGRFLHVADKDSGDSVAVHLLPYASEYRLGEAFLSHEGAGEFEYAEKVRELLDAPVPFDADHRILLSHLYAGDGRGLTEEEKPLFIGGSSVVPAAYFPETYDYSALGHLHSGRAITPSVVYSGSILPLIPQPQEREKYVQIVDVGSPASCRRVALQLHEILEVRTASSLDEALEPVEPGKALYLYFKDMDGPLGSTDIGRLKDRHGDALAALRVTVRDRGGEAEAGSGPGEVSEDLSPQEWFRRFYAFKKSGEPPPEVMRLYLSLLNLAEEER
jgi:exonuclease SbcD